MRKKRQTAAWRPDPKIMASQSQPRVPTVDGQVIEGDSVFVKYANLVKLPHTVFALPFALLGVVLASHKFDVTRTQLLLVVIAFTAARFAAMGFNRIVDRRLDSLNTRTADRELPAGKLTVAQASVAVTLASAIFIASSAGLNRLCLYLSFPALAWILGYSYSKRFTSWSHAWLGVSLAIAPVGGYIAVAGGWSDPAWILPVLACSVVFWVAGFDMFYSLQDENFDRNHDLHSAVVLLGKERSILVAKMFHGITIGMLGIFAWGAGLGVTFYGGLAIAAALMVWEHRLVKPDDLTRLDAAFFNVNGFVSVVIFVAAMADRLI